MLEANPRASFREGLRAGVPFAVAGLMLSFSFGVLADSAGLSELAAILMSAIVFAGSAQFAAIGIVAAGGSALTAAGAAALMNSRFLPMGVALAPFLPGRPLWRAAQGQAVVDPSWAMARTDEGFDRHLLFGATAVQYVSWVSGTAIGALGGGSLNPETYGLDAIFPAFFLYLLIAEIRERGGMAVALGGGAIALVLVPFVPPGVPVLVASLAALVGLRRHYAEPA